MCTKPQQWENLRFSVKEKREKKKNKNEIWIIRKIRFMPINEQSPNGKRIMGRIYTGLAQ